MCADGGLAAWAERSGRRCPGGPARGCLRFAFYGRVSTEDWQDPVTSRARQREQAGAPVRGHGQVVAEFFDVGQSRSVAWGRRPQAAALVTAPADPDRGWDALVLGEYERAFYGAQYALMAPLFEHYGVQLWMPEAGGRVSPGRRNIRLIHRSKHVTWPPRRDCPASGWYSVSHVRVTFRDISRLRRPTASSFTFSLSSNRGVFPRETLPPAPTVTTPKVALISPSPSTSSSTRSSISASLISNLN